ncbi:hypothetical protein EIN_083240, partial [Entamoeba invadens IP1]|uniref:hypothetical protein n=1 Tax=Entamoeba invadens IP1 TaxID=370355 RepID=UPI0002C3D27C
MENKGTGGYNRHNYPFCLPYPLKLPKRNFTKGFEKMRKEFRINEQLRREKMKEMLKSVDTTGKLKLRQNKDQSSIAGSMLKFLKSEKCSNCEKDILIGSLVNYCECCDAPLCDKCTRILPREYQQTVVEVPLCKYCDFIYTAVTEEIKVKNSRKEASEDPIHFLRCQIVNTCNSYLEEYFSLNLFINQLLSTKVPKKEDLKVCEEEMKVVKVKTQKVLGLDGFIDAFENPERQSDQIVTKNIVRALNQFKIETVFDSINEVNICEQLILECSGIHTVETKVIGMSTTLVPTTGGIVKISLNLTKDISVMINGIVFFYTIEGPSLIIKVPPANKDQIKADLKITCKGQNVELPEEIRYYDAGLNSTGEKVVSLVGNKRKICVVECDDTESESDESEVVSDLSDSI